MSEENKEKFHANIAICTPGEFLNRNYVSSLLGLLFELNNKKITWAFFNNTSSNVYTAREATVTGNIDIDFGNMDPFGGQLTYDKILWIDSDIAFNASDAIKLYESDKDVIAGMYIASDGSVPVIETELGKSIDIKTAMEKTEPFKVWGTGMGFMCVKNGVFESLSKPWFQSSSTKAFIVDKLFEFNLPAEDLSFCDRVGKSGKEVWIDPSVKVTHLKLMPLIWENNYNG